MQSMVLIGFKSCGKSTTGRLLATTLGLAFTDLDDVLEARYAALEGAERGCREIWQRHGEAFFRRLEAEALAGLMRTDGVILATGGGAPLHAPNRPLLKQIGRVVYLKAAPELLFSRFQVQGMPAFLRETPTLEAMRALWTARDAVYREVADVTVETGERPAAEVAGEVRRLLV